MPALLTTANAQGAGTPTVWGGGPGSFEAAGAFNGSTVTLQAKGLDGNYVDVTGTALTASGAKAFSLPPCAIRANVTAAAPTSVSAAAWRVRNP